MKVDNKACTSRPNCSNSSFVGGRFAAIYPRKNPERKRIIIYIHHPFYMLCLGFLCLLFVSHVYKLKSPTYRKQNTHQKIKQCYRYLHICARALTCIYSSHHVLKHFSLVQPVPYALLWIIPESKGFNCILALSMVHPYLGLLTACTHDITTLESILVLGIIKQATPQI